MELHNLELPDARAAGKRNAAVADEERADGYLFPGGWLQFLHACIIPNDPSFFFILDKAQFILENVQDGLECPICPKWGKRPPTDSHQINRSRDPQKTLILLERLKFKSDSHRKKMRRDMRTEKIYIYGKHALSEALLHAPRAVRKVFLATQAHADDPQLRELIKKSGVPLEITKEPAAARMVGEDTAHQGIIAIVNPDAITVDFHDFVKNLKPTEKTMLVLLDELTDPHNVGAIIRSAAAFGAAGVLLPPHNQAPITGAVVKASAGMVFRVPIVAIGNVNQTVDFLKEEGFKTYGLAMHGAQILADETFDAPALVIVGNEGKGIRQKTLERCDVTLRIPMDTRTESLNASVSAAIVLYAWSTRHFS